MFPFPFLLFSCFSSRIVSADSVRLLFLSGLDEAKRRLKAAGFAQLSEREEWSGLEPGRKYFFTRNHSTIVAFAIGGK